MAIELSNRSKILAGAMVLLAAGAGAWFFFLQDFLNEPPPAPRAAAAAPAKAAADAPKAAAAAAAAPKAADAAKADAPKAQAAAKPIPTNPDQLIAEVIEVSGLKGAFQPFGAEAARNAASGGQDSGISPEGARAVAEVMQRVFEPGKMNADVAANLKANLDTERMSRFLEILRQPIARKMAGEEMRKGSQEDFKTFAEAQRKNPPPAARVKLIQAVDNVTRSSEVGSELISAMARDMIDAMLSEMAKAGKKIPPEARKAVAAQLNAIRGKARSQIVGMMYYIYRDVSDEDLGAYVKLLDTDTGRWGTEQLMNAVRPVLTSRFSAFGREIAQIALANRLGTMAKAPAAAAVEPLAKASTEAAAEKPAAAPAAAAPAAPVEPVGYQRPASIRPLYARYNDVITATVMRDRAAVKELLDDGKFANARQADGTTPLMIAIGNGDADIAGMLLAKGADPTLRSHGGNTALSIARSRGTAGAGLVQLLQRAGAKE